MARALAPDERIGLLVESEYDGKGIRAARQDNSALAREAKASAATLTAGAQQGATAQQSLANAARAAANENIKVTVSGEQSRQMWIRSGGNYSRFLEFVRQHVAHEKELALATAAATAAQLQQNQAQTGGVGGGLNTAAAAAIRRVSTEVDKIPTKARTASNAISIMALTAMDGSGNMRGLAIAAGSAADGIAMVSGSARVAASAAGIGALVTILGTVWLLLDRAQKKAREAGAEIAQSLGPMADVALLEQALIIEEKFAKQQQRVEAARAMARTAPLGPQGLAATFQAFQEGLELDKIAAQREAVFEAMQDRRRDKARETSREILQQEEQDLERYKDLLGEMAISVQDHYNARTNSAEAAARLQVEREFSQRQAEIDSLQITEDQKTELLATAARDRAEKLLAIHLDAAQRQNEIEAKLYEQQRQRAERSLELVKDRMESALHAAITGSESFISAATKMLLSPLVRRLEALAVEQGIEALVELAFGDFVRAGRHAAVASAAILAAQKVAQMAGLTAGGGGGAGGGAVGPQLSNRDPRESPTNVTVVIQTVNPYSKELMGETSYQLNRSGVLKQPLYAPATTGAYLR